MNATATNLISDELLKAVAAVVHQITPGPAKLAETIRETVASALAARPPEVLQVKVNGLTVGEVKGRRRPDFTKIVRRVAAGVNTMLIGPAGCGKTTVARQVAEALGLQFSAISLADGVSASSLIGRFVPRGEGGRFEFVIADFVRLYRDGGLMLLDELDAADPNVLLAVNTALANGYLMTADPANPRIDMHPDFRCMATANTFGNGADRQYVGRNQLDTATLDRFMAGRFAVDYDEQFERDAAASVVGGMPWVMMCQTMRACIRKAGLRRVLSTRFIVDSLKCLNAGETASDLLQSLTLDWTDDERRRLKDASAALKQG